MFKMSRPDGGVAQLSRATVRVREVCDSMPVLGITSIVFLEKHFTLNY